MSVFLKYKKESKSAFGGKFRLTLNLGDIDVGDGFLLQLILPPSELTTSMLVMDDESKMCCREF